MRRHSGARTSRGCCSALTYFGTDDRGGEGAPFEHAILEDETNRARDLRLPLFFCNHLLDLVDVVHL